MLESEWRGSAADQRNAKLATAAWRVTGPAWKPGDLWLGRDMDGNGVGYGDDRHAICVAGSRSGKGRSMIVPNLLLWPGSCIVTDPKGENATRTAKARAKLPGHRVAVLDPRSVADVPDAFRVKFNPLALIDPEAEDAIDVASAIGDAMMVDSGDGKDVHWTESARQLIESLILHVATSEGGSRRSLVRVRQLLMLGDQETADRMTIARRIDDEDADAVGPFAALWFSMRNSDASDEAVRDVIAGAANAVLDMGENERGSVLSTARRNTKFIDSPWMRRCFAGADSFDLDAFKASERGMTLYVCLPARFIATHARFLRLIVNLTLFRMEAQGLAQPACGHPVLFVLDEFASLGRMEAIEKAAGLMAGFGVKLLPVLQDLGQLKRHYKESWETFLGNAGVLQFFANSDLTTLEWISKRMGQVEVVRETRGRSSSTTASRSASQSQSENAGWSRTTGSTDGISEMSDLQRRAAQDGGSGFMPFLARAGASATSTNTGRSTQDGQSGGESRQRGESSSSGTSDSETTNEAIHLVPLMNADEIARAFDRKTMQQIVFIDSVPHALRRTNYDSDDLFRAQQTA